MRDRVTFCIKTIHRPHCCATLVRSIHEHCGDERPLIYVLDDGKPELRFFADLSRRSSVAISIDRERDRNDIGLSAGRNRLVDDRPDPIRDLRAMTITWLVHRLG